MTGYVWQPDALQSHLVHSFSFSDAAPGAAQVSNDKLAFGDTTVGQVFSTGVPALSGECIVMPVAMQNRITAVLALSL